LAEFSQPGERKKEKEGANFQRYKGYLWGKFCAQVLRVQGKNLKPKVAIFRE
jgi:hypothetical protein